MLELAGAAPGTSYRFIPVAAQKGANPSGCRSPFEYGWLTLSLAVAVPGFCYRFFPVAAEKWFLGVFTSAVSYLGCPRTSSVLD